MDRLRNDTREAHIREMEVKTDLLSEREVARTEALRGNSETDNMLKALFSNRLFLGALAFFVLCVGGSLLYMQHVRHQDGEKLAETQDRVEQWNERQNPTTEVKTGDTSQGGHFHADGTWHEGPHETPPTAEKSEPVEKPPYLYDPDAKERPEGWDPELVFDTGEKKIDLNYRPLTEEEQAEYKHLKATLVPPEDYGVTEAGLRITAIGNIQRKNAPAFMESIKADIIAGRPREEIDAKLRTFSTVKDEVTPRRKGA